MNFITLYNETKRQKDNFRNNIQKNLGMEWNVCVHTHYKKPTFSIWCDDIDLLLSIDNNDIFVKENVGVDTFTEMKIIKTIRECLDEVGTKLALNEHQHQALINLIEAKKIDILESLGHDAISGVGLIYEMNLEELERKISEAIIENDALALGEIIMKLFMDYNIANIDERAQELKDEAKQEQDDNHGIYARDFY